MVESGYYGYTHLPAQVKQEAGTLLLSDSPEYVSQDGVLSAGTLEGDGRIYFYHVNEQDKDKKIAVVIENTSDKVNTIRINRTLKADPSSDYFKVGRDLSKADLEQPLRDSSLVESPLAKKPAKVSKKALKKGDKSKKHQQKVAPSHRALPFSGQARVEDQFDLGPGNRRVLFSQLNDVRVKPDDLFSGIIDLQTSQKAFVKVMMLSMEQDPVLASYWIKDLPIDDVRLRGTYHGMERTMAVATPFDSDQGGAYVEVGNDREDPFIQGVDEMDQQAAVKDAGNYGVSYHLTIPTTGEQPFRLYLNPQGGAYSGSFQVSTDTKSRRYDVGMPNIGHNTIYDTYDMGSYQGGDTLYLEFMPAGASNLPLKFLLVPERLIKEKTNIEVLADTMRPVALDFLKSFRLNS